MPQQQNATKRPEWVQLALRLALWMIPALVAPLLLGIAVDIFIGSSPWGLLFGLATGMFLGTYIIIRTIRVRFQALAPDSDDAKENS